MAKIDLQDAYFMVPIHGEHRGYLAFCLEGITYHFSCLPFGLSSAPWVFTKTLKPAMALLRGMGFRLVVYIDDILVMADTPAALREQVLALCYLLENLGFILSQKKCQLTPTQTIEFLGFTLNSLTMELKLPGEKSKKIRLEARKLLEAQQVQARDLSRLIGKMSAAMRAIPPAPLFYRTLQAELAQALAHHDQDYNAPLVLTREAKEELQWWIDHLLQWNGKALISPKPTVTITTDASLTGWGAYCQEIRTGGPWSFLEAQEHINWLELQAAFLGIKSFLRDRRSVSVLLQLDNTTAVAYINNLGGTVSHRLTLLARKLWMWCLERDISLTAQHLPGVLNTVADSESRVMRDRTDWQLNPIIFQQINRRLGPLEVDLFASRLTAHLPRYFSWRPDPLAEGTDAFLQDWSHILGFANPPWCLLGRVLAQVHTQQAQVILIAPVWKTQPWYPVLLNMLVSMPLLIQRQPQEVFLEVHRQSPVEVRPQLAVWPISGIDSETKAFQSSLQPCSWLHGGQRPHDLMTHSFRSGLAGVLSDLQIPFLVL
jgi:hypothetical protein